VPVREADPDGRDCVRAVLPHMGAGGSIVNVGAVVGLRGFPGDSMYGASKAGLQGEHTDGKFRRLGF
jgi:NAD(P)-dependent dehydrogenase (short-subunit alcohol dehydrogenase family)